MSADAKLKPTPGSRERELFLDALEKTDPRERAAFLAAACGEDHGLRQRLEGLLQEQAKVGAFLETPALAGDTKFVAIVTEKPGDRIGRYKLLQNIGEGGSGVVYMADQEEPVRRRVAVKVIKLGMDTRSVIARFEAERQALAMMDHPNIAKVLDAGATETGRPYFVMELVRGIKMTDYCDQNKMPTRDRLKLFIQVCQAIQHAHQKGIIHRDIKPSNILVTLHDGTPVPKVIDFGIVKATEQRLTDKTIFTQFNAFIGTPAYMSPEQAEMSGLDIDTRSDIYSLGVLLYELLTSKTPFDAEKLYRASLDECRRTIREEDPVQPSTRLATMVEAELTTTAGQRRIEAPRLIHLLRGDLDWIVMRCLEKDRTRRYATANDLAADVQRYLGDEPVLARPPSNLYRLRKVLHRHRGVFGAAAGITVALLAGTTISTWQAVRATRAEHIALTAQREESALRQRAVQGEAAARLNEYVADINLAKQSLDADNYGRAVQLLEKNRPQAGEPDLRGFEWRYLWQVSQGDQHIELPNQEGPVQSVTFSPRGEKVVIGSLDKFTVWDARTRALITNVPLGVISLAFFPDGKTLATAHPASWWGGGLGPGREAGPRPGRDSGPPPGRQGGPPREREGGPPRERDSGPPRGRERGPWPGRDAGSAPPRSPGPATVRLWNTADWTEQKSLPGITGPLALSRDGSRLAAMSREGVRVWDTSSWKEVRLLSGAFGPLTFSPDCKILATDSGAGITLWPLDSTRTELVLPNSTNLFVSGFLGPWFRLGRGMAFSSEGIRPGGTMTFSPDGKWVVATRNTLSERGVFVLGIWEAQSGGESAMPDDPEHIEHTGAISSLAFSPDGRILATASMDFSIRLWDFETRQRLATLRGHLSEVWTLAFAPDGQSLVSGAKDGSVKWWPVRGQQKEDILAGSFQPPLAISKDGRRLAAFRQGPRQGTMVFFDLTPREPELEQELPLEATRFRFASGVLLSEDLKTMVQSLDDGRVQLWNTETRETNVMRLSDRPVGLLALSPDGHSLITSSGGFGQTLRWWDLRSGTNVILESEAQRVLFSPDGRLLAAFQRTNIIDLWDAATRSLRMNLVSEVPLRIDLMSANLYAAFSADGRILAIVGTDDAVRLWETATGKLLGACIGHKQGVSSVTFSPDGKTLATASDDRTMKLWNVATQQELLSIRRLGGALHTLLFSPDGRLLIGRISTTSSTGGLRFYRAPLFTETDAANAQLARKSGPP